MKFSRFNIFLEYKGKHYISNTLSKSLIALDDKHFDVISSKNSYRLCEIEDSIPILKKNGIIVDDFLDEIGSLRFAYQQSKESTDELEIVVAPTMACNFQCVYCFETQRQGKMSETVQEKVLEFIENVVKEKRPRKIRFVWFGGEPLLCTDIIKRMSNAIHNVATAYNVQLYMIAITNGYLLNENMVTLLENCGISHLQITVDGDKQIHDSRRILKNGRGTFDQIIKNLYMFKNSPMTIGIRVNLDKDNIGQFFKVKSIIDKLSNPNIKCYPALVEPAAIHESELKSKCFCNECSEYYNSPDIIDHYSNRKLSDLGVQLCYCGAEHNNSFAIDELGNIYKCWNSIGYDSEIMCSVFEPNQKNSNVVSLFLGRDPFTEKDCIECPYIPVCGGGCLKQRIINGKNSCGEQRYIYESVIKREIETRFINKK